VEALGHNMTRVVSEAVAPTCTATGSTAVMGCTRCDVTEGGATVDALGHKDVVTLDHKCDVCGETVSDCEDKDPVDNACDICGNPMGIAKIGETVYATLQAAVDAAESGATITLLANAEETVTVSKAVTIEKGEYSATIMAGTGYELVPGTGVVIIQRVLWKVSNSNVDLENSLGLIFWISKANLVQGEEYYAFITRKHSNGAPTETEIVDMSEWEDYDSEHYRVHYNGLAAKEMTDEITIQIFRVDDEVVSKAYTDSIRLYGMYLINYYKTGKWVTLMVDMLNYGAAAQLEFNYATNDLANNQLTNAQKALGTQTVTMTDNWKDGERYYNTTLLLEENIVLNLMFEDLTEDMYAIVTYTDFYGRDRTYRYDSDSFDYRGVVSGKKIYGPWSSVKSYKLK
jgi:hypothetical protein